MWQDILQWVEQNQQALLWSAGLSVVLFFLTVLAAGAFVLWIPSDYFVRRYADRRKTAWTRRHPLAAGLIIIGRNMLGMLLIVAGIIMLAAPGQGLATLLIGVVLVDFPGKRRAERWLITRRAVYRSFNWFRRRFARRPLQIPDTAG